MTTDIPRTDAYNNSLGVFPSDFARNLERELAASKAEVELGNQLIARLDRERRNNESEVEEWVYRHSEMEAACADWMVRAEKAEAEVERLNGLLSNLLILTEKQYWNSTNYKQIKESHPAHK